MLQEGATDEWAEYPPYFLAAMHEWAEARVAAEEAVNRVQRRATGAKTNKPRTQPGLGVTRLQLLQRMRQRRREQAAAV